MRRAEWSEIDLEEAVWEIPAEKMKKRRPHAVPLSRQAVALLEGLRSLTGRWPYVFPSARNDGRPMSENAVRVALRSMGFSNEEMTAQGFRSLGSTALNTLGYRADVIEAALAHIQGGVRGVYNRSVYWEERRAMMQEWADWLDGLLTSGDSPPLTLRRNTEIKSAFFLLNPWLSIVVQVGIDAYYMLADAWKLSLYNSTNEEIEKTFASLNTGL